MPACKAFVQWWKGIRITIRLYTLSLFADFAKRRVNVRDMMKGIREHRFPCWLKKRFILHCVLKLWVAPGKYMVVMGSSFCDSS